MLIIMLMMGCSLFAAGVTGGFAGGEKGVQQYVEKGDVELAPEGKSRLPCSCIAISPALIRDCSLQLHLASGTTWYTGIKQLSEPCIALVDALPEDVCISLT